MASVQVEPNHVAGSSSHWPSPHPWKLYHNPHYSPRVIIHLSSSPRQTKNPDSPMIVVPDGGGGETELDQGYGAMSSELELCVARIGELRAELELERRMRRKAEALGEALAAELAEERRRGEAERRALLEEAVAAKAAAARAVEELEDERRMLRVAELWREERVQMKLADARAALEEKMREIDDAAAAGDSRKSSCCCSSSGGGGSPDGKASPASQRGQQSPSRSQHGQESPSRSQHGQVSRREAGGGENPHIRRGIKGCVEFPRAVRVRARDERVDLVSNLECQRAQLRVLMRHRSPAGGGIGLVGGAPENLVA
ncbi:unnamed protein product [Urochloa decumbens]|uniref:Uncharacterized protein n=1 Tax=Urochloa decumbens TaxID=240449 RepID=A0ABC8XG37_9POAL